METSEKKRNYSRKREAILQAVCSTTCHPTAEWVYQTLKPDYPDLSLGTVYRNLAQFKEDGVIASIGIVRGQERFDGNTRPHTHFVCSRCGDVVDIPGNFLEAAQIDEAAKKYRLSVESCDLMLRGLCGKCSQQG